MGVSDPFDGSWFERHPVEVAFDLVGSLIVADRGGDRVVARIVETEAYGGMEDGASHATMYRVGRQSLGHAPGALYMQLSYGLHTMTNIVAHRVGQMGAVLLRAAEDPVEGLDLVRKRRPGKDRALLIGPGNLSQGLGTCLSDTLKPLASEVGIFVLPGATPEEVRASPRIGISRATDAPWRFFDGTSRYVSRHRRGDIVRAVDVPGLTAALGPSLIEHA
jgi:DNA-3-methyladenine glycosylase